jgi:hypothetical protein
MKYMDKGSIFQVKNIIANNEKYSYLIVFLVAIILRLVPEILAFPYPIGYDVINYYLPVLKNFDNYWTSVSDQFPLYILLLHIVTSNLQIDARIVITASIVLIYGLFSVVIYSIARNNFHLNNFQSIYLSIFVIFQVALLRTSWDLHKDMFSLTIALFCISNLTRIQTISRNNVLIILPLSIIAVLSDRMIGFLLSSAFIVYSIIKRNRMLALLSIVTSIIFATALFSSFDILKSNIILDPQGGTVEQSYSDLNLLILFLVMSGILIPTGIIGISRSKNISLLIPTIISLFGSFSWLVYPNTSAFLPDRWIIIFSILLSIFSGYGFTSLIENKYRTTHGKKLRTYIVVLIPFIFLGTVFAMSPNNSYLNVYGAFHFFISHYEPLTMQYNSISLPESRSLLSAIDWINNDTNTAAGSVIMGSKHLRGWMELELKERTFLFADNNTKLLASNKYSELYLLELISRQSTEIPVNYLQELAYNSTDFSLYRLKLIR